MQSPDGRAHFSTPNGPLVSLDNPLTADVLTQQLLACLSVVPHHSVSFTGGEPLLYHKVLQQVLPRIQPVCKTYLETSGTQPELLAPLLPFIDMVAMDVKLPSATGERPYWAEHAEFLRLSLQTSVFIKLVFNDRLTDDELTNVVQLARVSPHIPVILQPETSLTALPGQTPPLNASQQTMFKAAEALQQAFTDVRLIPQTHKMVAVR
jgi:7-carboxy-7-deazaguanine synthase